MKKGKHCVVPLVFSFACAFLVSLFATSYDGNAAPALERKMIRIGVAAALKKPFGVAALRGAEMATKEINDAGGVLGSKIQLFSGDTEAIAPKATEVIEKLYYSDKVDAVVGAYSSEEATAFQEESAKLKINILFQGTTRLLDEKYNGNPEKYKFGWNYTPNDLAFIKYVKDYQLNLFVSALKKGLGLDKVNLAVITDQSLATEKIHIEWQNAVNAHPDCKLVYTGKVSRDAVDFTGEVTEMRNKKVQLILWYLGYSAGYPFVKQIYNIKLPVMTFGSNFLSWSISDYFKAVGTDAAAYSSTFCFNAHPTTPHTIKLLKKYEQAYGGTPHLSTGLAYNGVKAYCKAVEVARSLDQEKVQKVLEKQKLPESESWNCKAFWFDKHRVHVSPTDGLIMYTFQITPTGTTNIAHPTEYKTGDILISPLMAEAWKK